MAKWHLVGQNWSIFYLIGPFLGCVSGKFWCKFANQVGIQYLLFDRGVLVLCDWQVSLGFCGQNGIWWDKNRSIFYLIGTSWGCVDHAGFGANLHTDTISSI